MNVWVIQCDLNWLFQEWNLKDNQTSKWKKSFYSQHNQDSYVYLSPSRTLPVARTSALTFYFRIQRPEMEVARAKMYPAECLRVFYLKYFCVRSSVHFDISHSSAFRISVQLSIFPRCVAAWVWWNTWLDMFIKSQSYLSPLPWLSDDVIIHVQRWLIFVRWRHHWAFFYTSF